MFQTEFEFELPKGYVDKEGNLHKRGVMRLATAKDEIAPLSDYRVRNNEAFMIIILLARVVTKLGDLKNVDTNTIENLYSTDLAFLQRFYEQINTQETPDVTIQCPHCGESITMPIDEVLAPGE